MGPTPIVVLVAPASIPPTTNAGSWLIKRVDRSPQLSEHAHLADGLLPCVIGLFAVSVLVWIAFQKGHWLRRNRSRMPQALSSTRPTKPPSTPPSWARTPVLTTRARTPCPHQPPRPSLPRRDGSPSPGWFWSWQPWSSQSDP